MQSQVRRVSAGGEEDLKKEREAEEEEGKIHWKEVRG